MTETPTISVIVPMYNAEKYLTTCVNSILNQTFRDFELLLIDDCSTDNTLEIAKSFRDPRIKIIRSAKNLGNPGSVRNIGLDFARGEYVYFIDNDDAILKNALEILIRKMNETNADIIYSCCWFTPKNPEFNLLGKIEGVRQSTSSSPVSSNLKMRIWYELCKNHMHSVAWLCLYRRKLFENPAGKIRFPNCLAEDVFVHLDMLLATDKIVKIEDVFYVYRVRKDSLTHSQKNISNSIEAIFLLTNYVRRKLTPLIDDENYINNVCISLINGVSSIYLQPAFNEDGPKTYRKIEEHFTKHFSYFGTALADTFYSYLWGQNEAIKRTNMLKNLKKLLDENS